MGADSPLLGDLCWVPFTSGARPDPTAHCCRPLQPNCLGPAAWPPLLSHTASLLGAFPLSPMLPPAKHLDTCAVPSCPSRSDQGVSGPLDTQGPVGHSEACLATLGTLSPAPQTDLAQSLACWRLNARCYSPGSGLPACPCVRAVSPARATGRSACCAASALSRLPSYCAAAAPGSPRSSPGLGDRVRC